MISKIKMPVDTETLSESILPLVGILIKKSEFSFISLCTPLPSFPKISANFFIVYFNFVYILSFNITSVYPKAMFF